jgi:hypothetical protein
MNRMTHGTKGRIALALGLPGLLVVPGCLAVTDVSLPDIVGDWVATQARFANVANINETLDITDLGWEVTLQIDGDGTYILTLDEPGEPPDPRTGTISVENGKDLIVTNAAGKVGEGEVFQEDDQIAIMFDKFSGLKPVDIHKDGNPIPVTLLLVMVRQ